MSIRMILIYLVTFAFIANSAYADRRTSLAGNQFISDRDDVFIYPQLAIKYNRSISIDYGATDGSGNTLFIAGPNKSSAFGIALHRSDVINAIGGGFISSKDIELGMINGAQSNIDPAFTGPSTIADLIYAMKMGKNKLGFRLGLISSANENDPKNNQSTFGFRLSAGYSMKKGDFTFDIMNQSGTIVGDNKDVRTASVLGIHIGGRFFPMKKDGFKMGTLFSLSYMSGNDTDSSGSKDVASTNDQISVMAGFGPVYSTKAKKIKVAMHAHLGFRTENQDPNDSTDDDGVNNSSIIFPGFNMAFEYKMLDWLMFRSGANYNYPISMSSTPEEGDGTSERGNTAGDSGGTFGWNAGFGFVMDSLRIDGTLSHGFMTAGPDFIGGTGAGLFSMVSATAKF